MARSPSRSNKQARVDGSKYYEDQSIELMRQTAAFEHAVLKLPFALNGGAIGIFFAIYAGTKTSASPQIAGTVYAVVATLSWLSGLSLAAIATALSYYAQQAFQENMQFKATAARIDLGKVASQNPSEERDDAQRHATTKGQDGTCFRGFAKGIVVLSFLCFLAGVASAAVQFFGSNTADPRRACPAMQTSSSELHGVRKDDLSCPTTK